MKFVNLTPHDITVVVNGKTTVFPKTETVARCEMVRDKVDVINGIPIYATRYGNVTNLPPMQKNVIYIVSAMVKEKEYTRHDLVSPGNLIRDDRGVVTGCDGFHV